MKSEIKKQMLTFTIGILLGAIIATGVFLVLKTNDSSNNHGNRPEITEGERPSGDRGPRGKDSTNTSTDNTQTTESEKSTDEAS